MYTCGAGRRGSRGARRLAAIGIAIALVGPGCARRVPPPPAPIGSGFLDDYSRLAPGVGDQPSLAYRNPGAPWSTYDRILFEPVAIWRSGKASLADVPPTDLERLAFILQRSVAGRLGRSFTLVDAPGPGVLRVRLALTDARQDDPVLDIFTWAVPPTDTTVADDALAPATRRFVDAAAIEGEVSDAVSGSVLAAGVDRRRAQALTTWTEVQAGADRWAAWFAARLERAHDAD